MFVALALLAGACRSERGSVEVGKGKRIPGSPIGDAAISGEDGGIDLSDGSILLPDGAMVAPSDAGVDGGADPSAFDPTGCTIAADNNVAFDVPFKNEGGFALAPGVGSVPGFGLAYRSTGATAGSIEAAAVESTGPFPKPSPILDEGNKITELTLLSTLGGFRLGWLDNSAGTSGLEVQTMLLDDALKAGVKSTRQRITDNALVEHFPVAANLADTPVLAWIAEDTTTKKRSLWSQRVDGTAKPVTLVAESAGHAPIRLAIAEMGSKTDIINGAVAWVEEVAEQGIWLQRIDVAGKADGAPVRVSDLASAGSTVDLATRDGDGGAMIYGTVVQQSNYEVRFRRLDKTGALITQEIKIVSRPLQARDPSLARVGGGYAVVYRALPVAGSTITSPEIRMTFISKEGNLNRDPHGNLVSYSVAPATSSGGRTTVRLSNEGELLVAYVDAAPGGPAQLKLTRKRLDCTQ